MKPVIDALNDEEYCTQIIQVSLSIDRYLSKEEVQDAFVDEFMELDKSM